MSLAERTLAFAVQASEAPTRNQLIVSLQSVIEEIGATRFACLYLRRHKGEVVISHSISNLPRAWHERYLARGYEAIDPVYQGGVRSSTYGYWDELARAQGVGPAGREVMSAARAFGMSDGFTRRVTLDGGGAAVMIAAGAQLKRGARVRAALRMCFDVFANEGLRMTRGGGDCADRTGR